MNRSYLTAVLTLASLLGFGISANAEDAGRVTVTVPFEFVVGAKTMPAGTYTVGPVSPVRSGVVIRSYTNSVIVLPLTIDDPSPERVGLAFDHVGAKYFLTKIETPVAVFTIAIPQAMTRLAVVKIDSTGSSSAN